MVATVTQNGANYGPVSALSPGGSPFAWQNPEAVPVIVMISVGTVTLIEWSADGVTYYVVGLIGGPVRLNPRQYLRVTYVVAPTMVYTPI